MQNIMIIFSILLNIFNLFLILVLFSSVEFIDEYNEEDK